jgi:hypothetical protein
MRRTGIRMALLTAAITLGLPVVFADGAAAKVHGFSQAGCANNPAISGANQSDGNSPTAPIPDTSSSTGQEASNGAALPDFGGGDGDAACDTPAA